MTGQTVQVSPLAKAMGNRGGIAQDVLVLSKFIREILFYHIVHDLKNDKDDVLSEAGTLGKYFVYYFLLEENKSEITNS